MKPYLGTSGTIFGLITRAHLWRITEERHLAVEPWFLLLTLAAASLSFWAFRLLLSSAKPK